MGLFAFAGALRQGSTSRLGYLVFSERKLFWVSFLAGVLLISNASLPPFPSFFPELLIVISLGMKTFWVGLFVVLRLTVCFYNTYVFMLVRHVKSKEEIQLAFKNLEFLKL